MTCSSHLLSLFQKSKTITRSGTLYRRPFMRTSSTGIEGLSMAVEYSGCITSMFPLLYWRGFVISIGGACCFGIRRLGGWKGVKVRIGDQHPNKAHKNSFCMIGTHPLFIERRKSQ